jgi:hypothetical protein
MGRDNVVGIATRYELDGPGIESRWGRDFQHPSRPAPGRGVDHPPPSSAEVKEIVELYLYSPSGPSWSVLGRTLALPLSNTLFSTASSPTFDAANPSSCTQICRQMDSNLKYLVCILAEALTTLAENYASVIIVTRLWAGEPGRRRDLSLLYSVQTD